MEHIKPYVYKIYTPRGTGTGFQLSYAQNKQFIGIATALHVIDHAHDWEEPIKLVHHQSGATTILREAERVIFSYRDKDLAFILLNVGDLPVNTTDLSMIPPDKRLKQGVHMGWCGFPVVAPDQLCFFTGHMSSWLLDQKSYLVDGVAINGVSGGPAFTVDNKGPRICGVVSAYVPNRVTGETLPGVCLIRDVSPYRNALKTVSSLEEADEKAKEEKEELSETGESQSKAEAKPKARVQRKRIAKKKVAKKGAPKQKVAKKKVAKKGAPKQKVAKK